MNFDQRLDFYNGLSREAKKIIGGENMEDLLPLYFILYSYRHRLPISFTGTGLQGYVPGKDALQDRLYNASLTALGGDSSRFSDLSDLQGHIARLSRKNFEKEYPAILDVLLCSTTLAGGTEMWPNQSIAVTAANILREHGCNTVFGAFSGIGNLAVACDGMAFTGAEQNARANLIAEVLCDAFGIRGAEFLAEHPMNKWPDRKFDGVIGNLPSDADFFNEYRADRFLNLFNEQQRLFVNKLLDSGTAKKAAVMLVHFQFANRYDYGTTRKLICDKGLLESVIALPEDIFKEAYIPTYLLVLDMKGGHDKATFYDAAKSTSRRNPPFDHTIRHNAYDVRDFVREGEKITVSYDLIAKTSWSFNPSAYLQNAECLEGQTLVRLGDLVEIPPIDWIKGERHISHEDLSDSFDKVHNGIVPSAPDSFPGYCRVNGPGVLLSISRGTRKVGHTVVCGICREEGTYSVGDCITVLKPNTDKILPEYLALALMSDPSFAGFYQSIQEYWCDFVCTAPLLERRIPVIAGLAEQKMAVTDALKKAGTADVTYNVILAGTGKDTGIYRTLLSRYGCTVPYTTEYVEGENGLEEYLEKMSAEGTPVSRKADALIVDADIRLGQDGGGQAFDGLDAVLDMKPGIPLFVTSSHDISEIKEAGQISARRLRPVENGHYYKKTADGVPSEALGAAVRDSLDRRMSPEAKIRSRHKAAFEAAEWLDGAYADREIHAAEIISEFLMAAEEGMDTSRRLSDLRNVAHRIIEILKDCNAVPPIDNGAIPKLLSGGELYNSKDGKTYVQVVHIIENKSLVSSLIALIDIGNEATHTFRANANLGQAMLGTLLEFLTWFYGNREEFSGGVTNYWRVKSDGEQSWVEISGPAQVCEMDGKPFWYCKNVHLQVSQDLDIEPGDIITVRKASPEQKKAPQGVRFYAYCKNSKNPDGYTIDRSHRKPASEGGEG